MILRVKFPDDVNLELRRNLEGYTQKVDFSNTGRRGRGLEPAQVARHFQRSNCRQCCMPEVI